VLRNLLIMSFAWMATSFNYYMVGFLIKYFPGSIYINGVMSSISELIAYALGGVVYEKLGVKPSLVLCYMLSAVGGLLILVYEEETQFFSTEPKDAPDWIFPMLVIIAKFGIACTFTLVYVSNIDVFPRDFGASALGTTNFVARLVSVFAP
jgi:uncharacterized membrane protein